MKNKYRRPNIEHTRSTKDGWFQKQFAHEREVMIRRIVRHILNRGRRDGYFWMDKLNLGFVPLRDANLIGVAMKRLLHARRIERINSSRPSQLREQHGRLVWCYNYLGRS